MLVFILQGNPSQNVTYLSTAQHTNSNNTLPTQQVKILANDGTAIDSGMQIVQTPQGQVCLHDYIYNFSQALRNIESTLH